MMLSLFCKGLIDGFNLDDAQEIKNIERVTNHDSKSSGILIEEEMPITTRDC